VSGGISSIIITNSGSGYTSDPVVSISSPPSGAIATAVCYVFTGLQTYPNNGVYSGGNNGCSCIKSDGTCVVTGRSININALGSSAVTCANPTPCMFANITTVQQCVKVYDTYDNKFVIDIYGRLYGCGINNKYQLGNGTTTPSYILSIIPSITTPVLKFATGYNYNQANVSCLALTAIPGTLVTNGTNLYGWGANFDGELGSGNTTSIITPTLRSPSIPANTYIHDVFSTSTAGFGSSTFLLLKYTSSSGLGFAARDAGVYSCGKNNIGQLSIGNTFSALTYTRVICENVVAVGFFNMVDSPCEYLNNGQTYVIANWKTITILVAGNYKVRIPNIDTYGCVGNSTIQINKTAVATGVTSLLSSIGTTPGNNYTISTGTIPAVALAVGDIITITGASVSANNARWYISYQGTVNLDNVSAIAVSGNDNYSTTYFLQNYIGINGTRVNIVYACGYNDANSYYGTNYSTTSTYAVVSTMLVDNIVDLRSAACSNAGTNSSTTTVTALTESGNLYWWGYSTLQFTTISNNTTIFVNVPNKYIATIIWSSRGFPYGPNPEIAANEQDGSKIYKYIVKGSNTTNRSITILLKNGNVHNIGLGNVNGNGTIANNTVWVKSLFHRKDFIDLCCSAELNSPTNLYLTSTGDVYSTGNNLYGNFGASIMGDNNYMPGKMIF
jgi:alpha-tubulin suppressor-like RCC1 family protein